MNIEHGTLEKIDDQTARITFVRDLRHPVDRVWRAITDPEQLTAWFPSTIDGDRRAGAPLKFVFPFPDAPVMEGTMRVCDPPSVIEFDWGGDVIRIELLDHDGGTRLTLTDTFTEYAKAARDSGGWHACLDNLGNALAGLPKREDAWKDVSPYYYATYPKDATTAPVPDFHPDADEFNSELG
ncbi:MAG: hypothetical protein QOK28_1735 [Actinomycetota bacterium]|jgi:uncharacterized protein YndB with AHSA1/START domain